MQICVDIDMNIDKQRYNTIEIDTARAEGVGFILCKVRYIKVHKGGRLCHGMAKGRVF